ncbi:MAG: thioredoxin family protein [Muribaculaceae bacterium]|nr:thioredoxin family protein [Muribaculaceae bacterium]
MTENIKKTILIFSLFIGLLLTSSGFNRTSLNTSIGKDMPTIADEQINNALKQCENDGKYVLLSFWSTSDALSRQSVNDYTSWLKTNGNSKIDLLSVNFDKSERLFQEIVKRDGLNSDMQFNVSGNQAFKIKDEFHLDKGYGSILLDPSGKIIAHNPTREQLDDILFS